MLLFYFSTKKIAAENQKICFNPGNKGIIMILAGDIGGTKTELALFEDVKTRKIVKITKFVSKNYNSLEEILLEFLSSSPITLSSACFGIAGPIENNTGHPTNLPWLVDGSKIKQLLKIPSLYLINDLKANAWGISCLKEDELYVLAEGNPKQIGNQALISAGTGLGEAGLYFDGTTHTPFASEGGHSDFAPQDEEEIELWRYLQKKYGHVSYERLLCGAGLINIYQFFIEVKKEKELPELKQKFSEIDPAQCIYEYGSTGKCPVCKKAIERFVSIYGGETGNVALKFLALGGIYIGGGIAPKMLECLKKGPFLESFLRKGRFNKLLSRIRIQVILNPLTALLGAANYAETQEKK